MNRSYMPLLLVAAAMLVLPLLGALAAGRPLDDFLAFPPRTRYAEPAPFFWPAVLLLGLFVAAAIAPLVIRVVQGWWRMRAARARRARPLPWWGWAGAALTALAWVLAWNRFDWFRPFQPYTFTPLWLGYLLVMNGLVFRRTGRCWLVDRPGVYALLFPVSAAFWWLFEYLNRFVQNWYYTGAGELGSWEYFFHASLSFSTVLPAVAATYQWLASYPLWDAGFKKYLAFDIGSPAALARIGLVFGALGLIGLGAWPDYFFPLVWVAPLVVLVALEAQAGERHLLYGLARGDWRAPVVAAAAGLVCGFFWELWNWKSLARWVYTVPHVQALPLFEMPLLGYAGYLPFGMLCVAVVHRIAGEDTKSGSRFI